MILSLTTTTTLALLLNPLVSTGVAAGSSDVHVLTNDIFDAFIEKEPLALVKFDAPW
jgi:hypothetical protein